LLSYDLAPPPTPPLFPVRKVSLFLSLPVCCGSSLLTGEGGEGIGEEPNHRPPGSLVLYKSVNTLWWEEENILRIREVKEMRGSYIESSEKEV